MRWRDWTSARLGALALAIAVLVVGGALRWTQGVVALVVAAALVPLVTSRRVFDRRSPLVALIGLALALTIVQVIPLPHGLVEWLAPTGVGLRDDGAAVVGTSPWNTISFDVPAALRAVAFFAIVLGVAVLALRMATSESGRYRLLAFVAGTSAVAAVIAWVHSFVG